MNKILVLILYLTTALCSFNVFAYSQYKYSKSDLSIGYNIDRLYRDLRKGRINNKVAKTTKTKIMKSDIFNKEYSVWVNDLIKVNRISKLKNFDRCESINADLSEKLYLPLQNYCLDLYLKLYSKSNDNNYLQEKQYLEKNINKMIFPVRSSFVGFLKSIKNKKKFSKYVSNLVLASFKLHNDPIKPRLLDEILITTELTSYIQETGLIDRETTKYFKDKFYKIARHVRSSDHLDKITEAELMQEVDRMINYYEQNSDVIDQDYVKRNLIVIAKRYTGREYYNAVRFVLKKALELGKPEDYSDIMFFYMWPNLIEEEYRQADKIISQYQLDEKFENLDQRLQFWIAYTTEKIGKSRLANFFYEKVIKNSPISYYSVMSLKRLKQNKSIDRKVANKTSVLNPIYKWDVLPQDEYTTELVNSLTRISIFSTINQKDLLNLEQKRITNLNLSDLVRNKEIFPNSAEPKVREHITLHIAQILNQNKSYLNGFSTIYRGMRRNILSPSNDLLKTLFPTPYLKKISSLNTEGIDPYVVLSLIRQESAFNPKAKSHVGARGLMQMMPATARTLQRRISSRALTNPNTNLRLGIKYFKKLFTKYDGNLVYTLSAYNAGETRVKRWKEEYFKNKNILHLIESIPFNETNLYVKLIFRNLFFYKLLDGHKNDSPQSNVIFDVKLAEI